MLLTIASVYAGQLEPAEETNGKHASKPLPAGVDAEEMEEVPSNSTPEVTPVAPKALQSMDGLRLERWGNLLVEGKYDEALTLYKKFIEKILRENQSKLNNAFLDLINKGDGFYSQNSFEKALNFYAKAAGYGSRDCVVLKWGVRCVT